ncbi:MAG: L,D-transpeptidase [Hyphomicrobiaceae bacterium]
MTFSRVMRTASMIGSALVLAGALALPATAENTSSMPGTSSSSSSSGGGSGDWWGWGGGGSGGQLVAFSSKVKPGQIIVSFGDRMLYYVTTNGQAMAYPIAIPREKSRWSGSTYVSMKRVNPPWTPTPEMRKENPKLPAFVPGGHPLNPLGNRAMYLGSSMYRIHGTDAPWTIGEAVSKGCIRMYNEDVLDLYGRVPVGTRVLVTWNRYKT